MANNRMYLKCKICGEEFMLAKSYGSGFFREDYRGNLLREFNDFLDRHTFCTCDEYQGDEGNFILTYESDPVEIDIKKIEEAFDRLKDDNGMTFDEYLKWREKNYKPLPEIDAIPVEWLKDFFASIECEMIVNKEKITSDKIGDLVEYMIAEWNDQKGFWENG